MFRAMHPDHCLSPQITSQEGGEESVANVSKGIAVAFHSRNALNFRTRLALGNKAG